jgi:hypothetical protein
MLDSARIQITQTTELVAGAQSNRPDTCLIRYSIQNLDNRTHRVGLRFLLDCYIGSNDAVPYLVPGRHELCTSYEEFNDPVRMPDFIQALEREDLRDPGTIAQIQLKVGRSVEPPTRVTLGAYPNLRLRGTDRRCNQEKTMWDVPVMSMKSLPEGDSAVVLYWDQRELDPGKTREVGFAYGLGTVSGSEGKGQLALTIGGDFTPRGEFTATAYVSNPVPGQTATLTLPDGFELIGGEATQTVPAAGAGSNTSPVTWRVRAGGAGTHKLKAELSTGVSQTKEVRIRVKGIFGDN